MVIRRRGALLGLVTIGALVLAGCYLWRFGSDRGIVPFLVGGALLVVAIVHAIAWRESRLASLVVDMTGLQVRLGGGWATLAWHEIDRVDIAGRGRLGDGRLTVHPRDERRTLSGADLRCRLAVLLNRWLYDASIVVPYGLTTRVSVDDIPASLRRLADGRAQVVVLAEQAAEPEPTVEVSAARDRRDPESAATALASEPSWFGTSLDKATEHDAGNGAGAVPTREKTAAAPTRRLAAVVSALHSRGSSRRDEATVPIHFTPSTAGTLALSDHLSQETEPLPELQELRRRAPEDEDVEVEAEDDPGSRPEVAPAGWPTQTSNVELVIDATADLSARTMRKVRQPPAAAASLDPAGAASPTADQPTKLRSLGTATANVAIGAQLHEAREWLGISVDDLAERTRIRPFVIESIEMGDFAPSGGDFYARGHLRMLTGILGIDPAPILASYDEHIATAPVSPRAVFDAELSRGVLRPTGGGSRWGALIGTVLVLLLVWGVARFFLTDDDNGTTNSGQRAGSSAAGLTAPRINDPAIGDAVPPPVPPIHVTVKATAGTSRVVVWDRAMKVVYQGTLQAGKSAAVTGEAPLRVMAVDGAAVSLAGPGHPEAPMGTTDERVFLQVGAPKQ